MKKNIFLLTAFFSAVLIAAENPGLLFEATYESDGNMAELAKGDGRAYAFIPADRVLKKIEGIKPGTKALVRTNTQKLFYKAPGNFTGGQGTISFWFKMVNYDLANDDLQTIFSVIDNTGRKWPDAYHLRILKNKKEWKDFIVAQIYYKDETMEKALNIQVQQYTGTKKWKAGEWHNITITWDSKQMSLYLDGVPGNATLPKTKNLDVNGVQIPPNVPVKNFDFKFPEMTKAARIFVGNLFNAKKDCESGFDLIRIYDRPLTAAEVKALVDGDIKAK